MVVIRILGEKTAAEVEKLLKNVPTDLLSFMAERGAHAFQTESDAIKFFTGKNDITKEQLLKLFCAIRLDHNKNRSKGRYDWDAVKLKVQHHLRLCFPNAKFIQNVDDNTLSESRFLVVNHPTVCDMKIELLYDLFFRQHFWQQLIEFVKKL
uniref:Uncharacterized protein n=1 Tax=Panagrolaimus davidi TaxID=227884 RepID=A0A914QSD5_9BILA